MERRRNLDEADVGRFILYVPAKTIAVAYGSVVDCAAREKDARSQRFFAELIARGVVVIAAKAISSVRFRPVVEPVFEVETKGLGIGQAIAPAKASAAASITAAARPAARAAAPNVEVKSLVVCIIPVGTKSQFRAVPHHV